MAVGGEEKEEDEEREKKNNAWLHGQVRSQCLLLKRSGEEKGKNRQIIFVCMFVCVVKSSKFCLVR